MRCTDVQVLRWHNCQGHPHRSLPWAVLSPVLLLSQLPTVIRPEHNDCIVCVTRCIERIENLVKSTFERMTYTEAIEQLKKADRKFEFPVEWGANLQSEHERYLTEDLVGRPVVLVDFPKDIKAFYMRCNDDGKTVAAMDVLAPGIGQPDRKAAGGDGIERCDACTVHMGDELVAAADGEQRPGGRAIGGEPVRNRGLPG